MHTRVIVLAAGKGTRMQLDMPKVLVPLNGRPMILYLLDAIRGSGVDPRPVLVVGHQSARVREAVGEGVDYVEQKEQLGTGHAVLCAEKLLSGAADQVIVLYGDHPFVRPERIRELQALQKREQCPLALLTVVADDFTGWRAPLADFSRIVRDASGRIIDDIQVKDATPAELRIREVNPALFCFSAAWLWPNLKKITKDNAAREYYLTDLTKIAIAEGACIASLSIDPREAIGVNAPEHLAAAEKMISGAQ